MGQRVQFSSRMSGRLIVEVNDACSESISTVTGFLVSGQVTIREPRYREEDRTSQRIPNQRATASSARVINETTALSIFNSFRRLHDFCVFASLLLDLFDPRAKP